MNRIRSHVILDKISEISSQSPTYSPIGSKSYNHNRRINFALTNPSYLKFYTIYQQHQNKLNLVSKQTLIAQKQQKIQTLQTQLVNQKIKISQIKNYHQNRFNDQPLSLYSIFMGFLKSFKAILKTQKFKAEHKKILLLVLTSAKNQKQIFNKFLQLSLNWIQVIFSKISTILGRMIVNNQ